MKVFHRLRIMLGPARPFLLGKVIGAVRARLLERRLRRRSDLLNGAVYTPLSELRTIRHGLAPFPSQQWLDVNTATLLANAQRFVDGNLIVYGVNMYRSWHTDAHSGYTWPAQTWYSECILAKPDPQRPRGIDIRVPHEVGRCHHWPALALAAVVAPAQRDVFLAALEADVESFYETNPPQYGPQWTIAMGVGIRAANLALACDWLAQHALLDEPFGQRCAAMLVDHARHIEATIEWAGGMRTSHYLGNMLGLLAAGAYLQGEPQADAWFANASLVLTREWPVHFLPDGMSFEASTGYHRHIVDMMVLAAVFMRGHGPLPPAWMPWLQRSMQALQDLMVAGRVTPAIGDDDDGMAVKLLSYEPDVSWTFDAAALLGVDVRTEMPRVRAFPDFGLYLWNHGRCRTSFRCGPIGQWGKGGHAHNDQLSVTFSVDGVSVIIDPGVVCYGADPDRRNHDRSTAAHATLVPVGMEQNQWPDGAEGLFWMLPDRAKARIVACTDVDVTGEHNGFGAPHRRDMTIRDDGITVTDSWEGMPGHPADIVIPLRAGLRVELSDTEAMIRDDRLCCRLRWSNAMARLEETVASAGYGRSVNTQTLKLRGTASTVAWSIDILP